MKAREENIRMRRKQNQVIFLCLSFLCTVMVMTMGLRVVYHSNKTNKLDRITPIQENKAQFKPKEVNVRKDTKPELGKSWSALDMEKNEIYELLQNLSEEKFQKCSLKKLMFVRLHHDFGYSLKILSHTAIVAKECGMTLVVLPARVKEDDSSSSRENVLSLSKNILLRNLFDDVQLRNNGFCIMDYEDYPIKEKILPTYYMNQGWYSVNEVTRNGLSYEGSKHIIYPHDNIKFSKWIALLKARMGYIERRDKVFDDLDSFGKSEATALDPDINLPWPTLRIFPAQMIIKQDAFTNLTIPLSLLSGFYSSIKPSVDMERGLQEYLSYFFKGAPYVAFNSAIENCLDIAKNESSAMFERHGSSILCDLRYRELQLIKSFYDAQIEPVLHTYHAAQESSSGSMYKKQAQRDENEDSIIDNWHDIDFKYLASMIGVNKVADCGHLCIFYFDAFKYFLSVYSSVFIGSIRSQLNVQIVKSRCIKGKSPSAYIWPPLPDSALFSLSRKAEYNVCNLVNSELKIKNNDGAQCSCIGNASSQIDLVEIEKSAMKQWNAVLSNDYADLSPDSEASTIQIECCLREIYSVETLLASAPHM